MGAWDSKVSDIYNELSDWLNVRGGEVSDLPLSLINRARRTLWQYRPWDYLVKSHTFTIDANNEAAMPDDYGRMLNVGYDLNGDGIFDWFFHANDPRPDRRYEFSSTFTKEAGLVIKIKFPGTLSHTPQMKYIIDMPDCSEQTDYLFFPANLVLRGAQKARAIERGMSGLEVQALIDDYDKELRDFEQAHLYIDRAMDIYQKDSFYNEVQNPAYSLAGDVGPVYSEHSNSYDC